MDSAAPIESTGNSRGKRHWLKYLKWALLVTVLVFVLKRAADLWNEDDLAQVQIEFIWLLPATVFYVAGWIPSTWFLREIIHATGGRISFRDATRSYYCGHLGKYIPGKAMVLVIRAGLLKGRGTTATAAVIAGTYETLAIMGTGLAIGIALAPTILSDAQWARIPAALRAFQNHPTLIALVVAAAVAVILPFVSQVSSWIVQRFAPKVQLGDDEPRQTVQISTRLLYAGTIAFIFAWAMHGLSLGFTLRAVSPDAFQWRDWPMWTATVSAATSLGFFAVFAPGGIGIREGILIEALRIQTNVGPQVAVVAAVLLRIVWFAAEIIVAALLYWGLRPTPTDSSANDSPEAASPSPPE